MACGRLDAYYERGLAPWDLAAGGLIATEAGAVVTDLAGGPPRADSVLAAAPGIAGALLDLLATPATSGRRLDAPSVLGSVAPMSSDRKENGT